MGQVIEGVDELPHALAVACDRQRLFAARQQAAFDATFHTVPGETAAHRAAKKLLHFM